MTATLSSITHLHAKLPSLIQHLWQSVISGEKSLWQDPAAYDFLGWLSLPDDTSLSTITEAGTRFLRDDTTHIVLIGIGGSALGARLLSHLPDAYRLKMPPKALIPAPKLLVLDTLEPEKIQSITHQIRAKTTQIIVASKSGSTMEIMALYRYFRAWMEGGDTLTPAVGARFAAITDPHSPLSKMAGDEFFSEVVWGNPAIGGRFSLFSAFGLFPALCAGFDINLIVKEAAVAQSVCAQPDLANNLGARLGAVFSLLQAHGKNKLAFLFDNTQNPASGHFAHWLEQLIAECTGKGAHGLLPFYLSQEKAKENASTLFAADIAVMDINMPLSTLIASFDHLPPAKFEMDKSFLANAYHYFFAMAIYGLLQSFNPFDQPDVEATKVVMRRLMREHEEHKPNPASQKGLLPMIESPKVLEYFLGDLSADGFLVVMDYLSESSRSAINPTRVQNHWQKTLGRPVLWVMGPSFLHSIGQLFKGATLALKGRFVVLFDDPHVISAPLPIPSMNIDFVTMRSLQAMADAQVMQERGRKIVVLQSPAWLSQVL